MVERSRTVEASARSVEDAIHKALEQLGVGREEVDVEVVREGSRGLLGLLSEDAVVRVTLKGRAAAEEAAETVAEVEETAEEVAVLPPVEEGPEVARLGSEVLEKLISSMGLRARVSVGRAPPDSGTSPGALVLNVDGDDLGALIGRRGETLRDLQYLTCLILSRSLQRWPNLMVDVEHYRSRRERSLIDLARRMAEHVRRTSEPVALEPMPPDERRIVHLALHDDPDVYTESVGQGEARKVTILPKH